MKEPEILYEDRHLICAFKPAGVLVHGDRTRDETLQRLIKSRLPKGPSSYLGVVHRLDRVVSGVVVFAKSPKVAARLSEAFAESEVIKVYVAVVEGVLRRKRGVFLDYIRWNPARGRAEVVEESVGKEAITRFEVIATTQKDTVLALYPETGRKHQLRVQLASRGHPVVGDKRYGSSKKVLSGRAILLHCAALKIPHPKEERDLLVKAPVPHYFPEREVIEQWVLRWE